MRIDGIWLGRDRVLNIKIGTDRQEDPEVYTQFMAFLQAYQSHGHRYYRIVESFRRDGKPRVRVVAHYSGPQNVDQAIG
jgi:hypothetical protein